MNYATLLTPKGLLLLFFLCVHVCFMYMQGSMEAKEKLDSLELVLQLVVSCLTWVWETNLNTLEKQLALNRAITPGPCVLIALH